MATSPTRRLLPIIVVVAVVLVGSAFVAVNGFSRGGSNTTTGSTTSPTTSRSTLAPHSIGYVGCSNTADAVTGYFLVPNAGLFWSPYQTGGGSLDRWVSPTSNYWLLFQQQVQKYGAPSIVWIEICELHTTPLNFTMVQHVFAVLKTQAPSAVYYISPLNSYSPSGICGLTGPNGVADATTLANQAVAGGLARAGPTIGPLTSQNTQSDMCHPNQAGEMLLGSQLVGFFDRVGG